MDKEERYIQSCYGLTVEERLTRHTFKRGTETRTYSATTRELGRLIEEETREGWEYVGKAID